MNELQKQSQHSSRAKRSLSPWSSKADLDESWPFDHNETFEYIELEAFNHGSEPGVSAANHANDEADLPEFSDWHAVTEEMKRGDYDAVPEYGTLSSALMESRISQGEVSMDALQRSLESPTRSTPDQQATQIPTKPSETFCVQSNRGNPTTLEDLSIPLPRVVVSDTALDSVGNDKKCAVPESHANTSSATIRSHTTSNWGQNLHKSEGSSKSSSQVLDLNPYFPNNFEIAMHDPRLPSNAISGIEFQFGTPAAASVSAFNADADSITANIAAVSTIDESFRVKRRQFPSDLSMLQTPTRTPHRSQHWQSSSDSTGPYSKVQNSSPTSLCPPSPSSLEGMSEHHQLDSVYDGHTLPSTSATPLSSPVSPSPSSPFDMTDSITRCPSCPDKIFTGTREDQKNSLQRHRRDAHDGMPRLACLVLGCSITFGPGRKDNRVRHVRAIHPEYPLPAPSRKRKRTIESDLESCSADFNSFESAK